MLQKILDNVCKLRPRNVPLGRWCRTEKDHNDIKVDLANMDHCGTCASDKIKEAQTVKKEIKKVNPADIYMRF